MRFVALLLPAFLLGCSLSPRDVAINSANSVREFAATEAAIIDAYCVPKYAAAATKDDIRAADKVCIPARASYLSTKAAWSALVSAIQLSKAGDATDAEIEDAGRRLGVAFANLKKAMEGLR